MVGSIKSYCLLLFAFILPAHFSASMAGVAVSVSINIAPPALPVYEQPVCPGPGYLWVPGYWAYGPDDYYWVPGIWVVAPQPGLLWTPGYWSWLSGGYVWHAGYWGPHVGFYGGICYGFGYTGVGFIGGYWRSGVYYYNRAVTNVNVAVIHTTYSRKVAKRTAITRVSYNGGTGGTLARPTAVQLAAARETHVVATAEQAQHQQAASTNRALMASVNHGQPSPAALTKREAASSATRGERIPRQSILLQRRAAKPPQPMHPR